MNVSPYTLKNIKLLNTRPALLGKSLTQKIKKLGGQCLSLPTVLIESIPLSPKFEQLINQLETFNVAIFISPTAVLESVEKIINERSQWPKKVKITALGMGTVRQLKKYGLHVDFCPQEQNSEGVLALPWFNQAIGKKIIFFQGEEGRTHLAKVLREKGNLVEQVIFYRRVCPILSQDKLQEFIQFLEGSNETCPSLILCTSETSLKNLIAWVTPSFTELLLNAQVLVTSIRLAHLLPQFGFVKPPLIADNASDDAIINYLRSFLGE